MRDRMLEDCWRGRGRPLIIRGGENAGMWPRRLVVSVSERAFKEVPHLIPSTWTVQAARYIVMPGNVEMTFRSVHNSETWEPWQWAMWGSTVASRFSNAVPSSTAKRLGGPMDMPVSMWPSAMHQAWQDRAMASMRHHTPNGTVSTVFMGVRVTGGMRLRTGVINPLGREESFFQTTVFGGPCSHWYKLSTTKEEAISAHMAALGVLSNPHIKRHKKLLWQLTPGLPIDIEAERYSNPLGPVGRLAY